MRLLTLYYLLMSYHIVTLPVLLPDGMLKFTCLVTDVGLSSNQGACINQGKWIM